MRITALSPAFLLGASIAACTAYQNLADPASELAASPSYITQVRLTLRTGQRFTLTSPCVFGDSLSGMPRNGPEVHVALADVSLVQASMPRKGGTAAFTDAMVLANSDMWVRRSNAASCPRSGR